MTTTTPLPTPERRRIVQEFGEHARILDAEAARRAGGGTHDAIVKHELMRSAGSIRLVATLVVNGSMSTRRAKFWLASSRAYLALVSRADRDGVIA